MLSSVTGLFGGLFGNDESSEQDNETESNVENEASLDEKLEEVSKLDNAKLDLSEVINDVDLGSIPLPKVEVNGFGLFGVGYNEGHGNPTSTNRHPICGYNESTNGNTCSGHTIDGYTFYHDKLSGVDTAYRGIEARFPDLSDKSVTSTVSVTTDLAVAIFKDAGKDNYTLTEEYMLKAV